MLIGNKESLPVHSKEKSCSASFLAFNQCNLISYCDKSITAGSRNLGPWTFLRLPRNVIFLNFVIA